MIKELAELRVELDAAMEKVANLKFCKEEFRHQIEVGFSLSTLERLDSFHLLLNNDRPYDTKILLRSALEHFIYLRAISSGKVNPDDIKLDFAHREATILREARSGNPYFAKIAENIDVATQLADFEKINRALFEAGAKKRTTQDIFRKGDATNEYESVYRSLSKQVHPTYSGLIDRHFEIDSISQDFVVFGFKKAPDASVEALLSTAMGITNEVSGIIESLSSR